ncbi:MAG: hypothetical protein IKZ08_03040 [Bacteroidales bacterium]|nr:hypothetical protein [Bacteroidales bacterium]
MKTFTYKGKKYRWNPKKSPLYIPVMTLMFAAGVACWYLLGAAMCSA